MVGHLATPARAALITPRAIAPHSYKTELVLNLSLRKLVGTVFRLSVRV